VLITVYSLPGSVCIKCRATEISMRRKGIEAVKIRVDLDAEAMEYIKSLGYTEAPVTVVTDDGRVVDHWSGFSEEKIDGLRDLVTV
jgi:glutaredoxin-like protein NrdH